MTRERDTETQVNCNNMKSKAKFKTRNGTVITLEKLLHIVERSLISR